MNKPNLRRFGRKDDVKSFGAPVSDDDWVHELIAMTRPGVDIEFPSRTLGGRVIPFQYDDFS